MTWKDDIKKEDLYINEDLVDDVRKLGNIITKFINKWNEGDIADRDYVGKKAFKELDKNLLDALDPIKILTKR